MKRLKQLRKAKKLTQLQMQMTTGIDQSNISKMERGMIEPSIEQLKMFADSYNTSIDYLTEFTDVKEAYPRKEK